MNARATKAYDEALRGGDTPQIEYATRRIGGPARLKGNLPAFTRAYNEAPIVDADLDTNLVRRKILVRDLEPKDGVE